MIWCGIPLELGKDNKDLSLLNFLSLLCFQSYFLAVTFDFHIFFFSPWPSWGCIIFYSLMIICDQICKKGHIQMWKAITLISKDLRGWNLLELSTYIGASSWPKFKSVALTNLELQIVKVVKLDVCGWPLFANPVTINVHKFVNNIEKPSRCDITYIPVQ